MEEADIYGDDLYGDTSLEFHRTSDNAGTSGHAADAAKVMQNHAGTTSTGAANATEAELRAEVEAWRTAFQDEAFAAFRDVQGGLQPAALAAEVKRALAAEAAAQEEGKAGKQREAALQLALSEKVLEALELRKHLHTARQSADPSIIQVRQLLLDPAVNREFARLRGESEERGRRIKALQEELTALTFTQDSKTGRMLMAKCRLLQDENEEMGREMAEGKVAGLERSAALAKEAVEDMRRAYTALEDHCFLLDQENEELQTQLFVVRRHVRDSAGDGRGEGRPSKRSPYVSSPQQRRPLREGGKPPFSRGFNAGSGPPDRKRAPPQLDSRDHYSDSRRRLR